MAKTLSLKVVTPTGPVVEKVVTAFTARSDIGEFCILPGHALLLTSLAAGRMIIAGDEGGEETFALDTGFLEGGPGHVHVITDHCEAAGDINAEAVKGEIADLENQLKDNALAPALRTELTRKLAWAEARLGVAG
jgi:F-type H+-transporting ATPase subunit epsilon